MTEQELLQKFTTRAEAVSAKVVPAESRFQAYEQIVRECVHKEACEILSGCEQPLSEKAADLCSLKEWNKIMAAPDLSSQDLENLQPLCRAQGIALITQGLRSNLGGIDIAITQADLGLAETGSVVINSTLEEVRLASMICEMHMVLLPASKIFPQSFDIEKELEKLFAEGVSYISFITGPSRTADIERVLTLGVHGPLAVHIYVLEQE